MVHIIPIGIFLLLGILFLNGKGAFLIAGYNTASKEEKEKIDEKKLCKYMSRLMFTFAGCFVIAGLGDFFDKMWLFLLGIAAFVAVMIGGMIYINTGNRLSK